MWNAEQGGIRIPENLEPFSMIEGLALIFRRYRTSAAPSNTEPQFLRVVIGDTRIAVGYHLSNHPAEPETIRKFLEAALGSFYHYFVFVSNQPLSDRLKDYAKAHEVILLDREDIIKELGEAYLLQIETFSTPIISHNGQNGEDGKEVHIQRRPVTEEGNEETEPELIRVLKGYMVKHAPEPEMPGITSSVRPQETEVKVKQEGIKPPEGAIIRIEIPISRLKEVVPDIGRINVAQMELIPYFLFSYTCRNVDEEKNLVSEGSGVLAVNGVTSDVEEWEPGFQTVNGLNMDYIRLVPRLDRKVSRELAYNGVIRLNSRTITAVVDEDGMKKTVKRKTIPEPDTIHLNFQGIFYFPHWHVKGESGSALIDAVNGEVISRQA